MTAYRIRLVLLVLGESCLLGFVWWIAGPLLFGANAETAAPIICWLPTALLNFVLPEGASDSMIHGFNLAIFFGCMLLTQSFFLRPRRRWTVGLGAGLVFGATVMIWAFGPGLIFVFPARSPVSPGSAAVSRSHRRPACRDRWDGNRTFVGLTSTAS